MTAGNVPSVDRWRTSTTRGISTSVPIATARFGAPGAIRPTSSAPASEGVQALIGGMSGARGRGGSSDGPPRRRGRTVMPGSVDPRVRLLHNLAPLVGYRTPRFLLHRSGRSRISREASSRGVPVSPRPRRISLHPTGRRCVMPAPWLLRRRERDAIVSGPEKKKVLDLRSIFGLEATVTTPAVATDGAYVEMDVVLGRPHERPLPPCAVSFSPDNVHETGVSPGGQSRS